MNYVLWLDSRKEGGLFRKRAGAGGLDSCVDRYGPLRAVRSRFGGQQRGWG